MTERDEGRYYVATVPGRRGCHTQAKKLDTLLERVHEAIELCLTCQPLNFAIFLPCPRKGGIMPVGSTL